MKNIKVGVFDFDGCLYSPAEVFFPLQNGDNETFSKNFNPCLLSPTLMDKLIAEKYDAVYGCTHRDLENISVNTLNPMSEALIPWIKYLEARKFLYPNEIEQLYLSSFTTNIVQNLESTLNKNNIPIVKVSMPRDIPEKKLGFGFEHIIKRYESQVLAQKDLLVMEKYEELCDVAGKYAKKTGAHYDANFGIVPRAVFSNKNDQMTLILEDIVRRYPKEEYDTIEIDFFDDRKDILESAKKYFTDENPLDSRLKLTLFHHDPYGALVEKKPDRICHAIGTVSHKPKPEINTVSNPMIFSATSQDSRKHGRDVRDEVVLPAPRVKKQKTAP